MGSMEEGLQFLPLVSLLTEVSVLGLNGLEVLGYFCVLALLFKAGELALSMVNTGR